MHRWWILPLYLTLYDPSGQIETHQPENRKRHCYAINNSASKCLDIGKIKSSENSYTILETNNTLGHSCKTCNAWHQKSRYLRKYCSANRHLIIYCPAQKIIHNQTLDHIMFTSSIIHTSTILDKPIRVPPQIITWNDLQENIYSR